MRKKVEYAVIHPCDLTNWMFLGDGPESQATQFGMENQLFVVRVVTYRTSFRNYIKLKLLYNPFKS